jgi:type III pantothenate kinase
MSAIPNLLVDIGNTSLKWAIGESGVLSEMQTLRHGRGLPIDLHAAWEQLKRPRRILVSNVGGTRMGEAVKNACRAYWEREPIFAATEHSAHGVTIAYERPERLGVDRWLVLLAAHRTCEGPVLIVDAGTAITYDLMLGNGRHLGGLILPGIETMRDGLLAGTHIPRVEPTELADPWAADTGDAIAAGSIQAPTALAERLLERLARQADSTPTCILTGGDADRLIPALGILVQQRPDLVLQGLALLA